MIGVGAALILAACGGPAAHAATPAKGGGVVTYAELPDTAPNYISPMESSVYLDDNDGPQFSAILWPALYRLGNHNNPGIDWALSVGKPPVYSDNNTVVTITMKHWDWSNGTPITARDVIFWMNLISAVSDPNVPVIGSSSAPGPGWGDSVPGEFPENVKSYKQTGTYSMVFDLNASYNPTWFTDDELVQLIPVPQATWDRLSLSGPVGNYDESAQAEKLLAVTANQTCTDCYAPVDPGTATTGALGVAQFINTQSQDLSTYATNPIWKVVSGAFKLSQFTTSGYVKFVPNPAYSGPFKPKISAFEELPYSSDAAEFDALRSGSLDIGYVPPEDLGLRGSLEKTDGLKFSPWYTFGTTMSPFNLTNPTVGPIFQQLYFRQAFQDLINQPEYIKDFAGGIGTIDNGPIPTYPPHNSQVSPLEAKKAVFPYDPAKAVSLLKSHGWTVNPGGTSVCSKPGTGAGECGAGIKASQPANFQVLYESGQDELTNEVVAMQSTMRSKAGIDLTLKQGSFADVIGIGFVNCTFANPCSDWDIIDWATTDTWTYDDGLATGGVFFSVAGVNAGDYDSPVNTANITATETAPNAAAETKALYKYEDYVAEQVPMMMLPNGPFQLTMYKKNLKGLVPQGIYADINPQYYALTG